MSYGFILEHSAKGTTWKDHKYESKKNKDGKVIYIYPGAKKLANMASEGIDVKVNKMEKTADELDKKAQDAEQQYGKFLSTNIKNLSYNDYLEAKYIALTGEYAGQKVPEKDLREAKAFVKENEKRYSYRNDLNTASGVMEEIRRNSERRDSIRAQKEKLDADREAASEKAKNYMAQMNNSDIKHLKDSKDFMINALSKVKNKIIKK